MGNLGEGKAPQLSLPRALLLLALSTTSSDVVFPLFSCAELQSLEKQLVSAGNGWVCAVLSRNLDTVHEAGEMEEGKNISEKVFVRSWSASGCAKLL